MEGKEAFMAAVSAVDFVRGHRHTRVCCCSLLSVLPEADLDVGAGVSRIPFALPST